MSAPTFPFTIARRDGRLTRPIMCRRCAGWTAFDGTQWRHENGSPACVDPDALYQQKEASMTNADIHEALQPPAGLTKKQLAEFERAKAVGARAIAKQAAEIAEAEARIEARKVDPNPPVFTKVGATVPKEFNEALELVPQHGEPFASSAERTTLAAIVKRAYAFFQQTDVKPDVIDKFNDYITHTNPGSRTATMSTTKKNGNGAPKTPKAPKASAGNAASSSVTEADIDDFIAKQAASGAKMSKGAIVDVIRGSGRKIGVAGGDYLAAALAKRPKASTPAEKPVKATPATKAAKPSAKKPAAPKATKSAEGNVLSPQAQALTASAMKNRGKALAAEQAKPLTRTKVTMLPKAKAKKATAKKAS